MLGCYDSPTQLLLMLQQMCLAGCIQSFACFALHGSYNLLLVLHYMAAIRFCQHFCFTRLCFFAFKVCFRLHAGKAMTESVGDSIYS